MNMGASAKLSFMALFGVTAVTMARGFLLWRWSLWSTRVARGAAADAPAMLQRCRRARAQATSTHGLAQAALWLTLSGGAISLVTAAHVIENTSRPMLAIIAERALDAIDATAFALGLCGLLFTAAWLFALVVDRGMDRLRAGLPDDGSQMAGAFASLDDERVHRRFARVRRVLGVVGIVLVVDALLRMHPAYDAELETMGERALGWAAFHALWHPWPRLAVGCAALGLLLWVSVLVEGVVLRRQGAVRPLASAGRPSGS
jgi:hypothetical protein